MADNEVRCQVLFFQGTRLHFQALQLKDSPLSKTKNNYEHIRKNILVWDTGHGNQTKGGRVKVSTLGSETPAGTHLSQRVTKTEERVGTRDPLLPAASPGEAGATERGPPARLPCA